MGKTVHSKIALRIPTNWVGGKPRKDYQDNERPKNSPSGLFFKHRIYGVIREDQFDGHRSGGRAKRIYSRILRKKLKNETITLIKEYLTLINNY